MSDPLAVAAAMAPFLKWAAEELAPEESAYVTDLLRRFIAANVPAGMAAVDADIDARLAELEKNGR